MTPQEIASKLEALNAQAAELLEKMQTASKDEKEGLMRCISEIQDERCRVMGLSEAEIVEINAEAKAWTKEQIQREVEIGLSAIEAMSSTKH
jgi:hypothetical protein